MVGKSAKKMVLQTHKNLKRSSTLSIQHAFVHSISWSKADKEMGLFPYT
jgi:hypothetical protein